VKARLWSGYPGRVVQRGLTAGLLVVAACRTPPSVPGPAETAAAPQASTASSAALAPAPLAAPSTSTASTPTPAPSAAAVAPSPAAVIAAIAGEIDRLKPACPQLVEFDREKHVDLAGARIDYGYHTHRSTRPGGWVSGVPNPDPDGVWFYIDVHDPASTAQIHTQPVTPMLHVGDKLLMMLILEGERVPPCAGKIRAILNRYGRGPPTL
jgi:hypothetical protein